MSEGIREEVMQKRLEKQKNLDALYATVFGSEEGRIVREDLMHFCNMYNSCFGKDNNETNKMLGSRTVGLYIVDRCNQVFSKTAEKQLNGNYLGEPKDGKEGNKS